MTHATEEQNITWLKSLNLELPGNVEMLGDPSRQLYAQWGVGEIGLSKIFALDGLKKVAELVRTPLRIT